jgi:membrane dipeptidase
MTDPQAGALHPAAAALHRDAVVADTHNDLLMLVSRRPPEAQAAYFREHWLPQLRAGGVDVQVLPVFIDDDFRPEGAMRQTLRMIEAGHRVAEGNPDTVRLCRTGADIDATLADGRVALVLALEGCEAVGTDVELLRTLARLGIRMASFTHFGRTALADGSAEDDAGSRLTSAGVAAVALLEELGVLIDVSHLSATGTDHVLSLATRPVVASHSCSYAVRPHHRNLTDERLKGIAASGGVVGVNFYYGFVDPDSPTVGRLADHLEHVASVAGIDHVGLGPDFVKEVYEQLTPSAASVDFEGMSGTVTIPGLETPAGLPLVTEELLRRGWPEDDIRKVLGENWLRVFRSDLGVPGAR